MKKKILPLFIILTFAIGIIAEANIFHALEESIEQVTSSSVENGHDHESDIINDDNCEDKECHDTDSHCSHHCSGVHNVVTRSYIVKFNSTFKQISKTPWHYLVQYQMPSIDSALRPPAHS